ncbi:MAG: tetratricopeptide repeat protein [Oscillatoriales cyanobacterium SM2_2_1]|nr:tetratricopeptide repeat protein [Oscillatoriales cyanobacterium SM2_2_1]
MNETWLRRGDRALEVKDWERAIACYQEAMRQELLPPHLAAQVHYCMATAWEGRGHPLVAISSLQKAIACDPQHWFAHVYLGDCCQRQGWQELAIQHYLTALAGSPSSFTADAHVRLGNTLALRQSWAEAITCYQRALKVNRHEVSAYTSLVEVHIAQGHLEQAAELCATAQATAPDLITAACLNHLGVAYARQRNDRPQALNYFQQAIAQSPTYAPGHCNLGVILFQQGELREAILAYKEATDLDPHLGQCFYNLSVALQQSGCAEEAQACFRAAHALIPTLNHVDFVL